MILEASLIVLAVASVAALFTKDLLHAVIVLAIADVSLALIFLLLQAPDIAVTQIAVTGGLTTVIYLVAIGKTRRLEQ